MDVSRNDITVLSTRRTRHGVRAADLSLFLSGYLVKRTRRRAHTRTRTSGTRRYGNFHYRVAAAAAAEGLSREFLVLESSRRADNFLLQPTRGVVLPSPPLHARHPSEHARIRNTPSTVVRSPTVRVVIRLRYTIVTVSTRRSSSARVRCPRPGV